MRRSSGLATWNRRPAPTAPILDEGNTAMNATDQEHLHDTRGQSSLNRRMRTALLMVALIGGFYLLREHWIHVAGNWVYLLLLACPLMHLLHGHGGDGGHGAPPDKPANREA
jgi:hypothetical protein